MKKTKLVPFSERTYANIYLEYLNDWLTVKAMAENYNRTEETMKAIIDMGRTEHENNVRAMNQLINTIK